jgi:hypothetical protein
MPGSLKGQGCFMEWFELDFDKEPLLTLIESLALSRARKQNPPTTVLRVTNRVLSSWMSPSTLKPPLSLR